MGCGTGSLTFQIPETMASVTAIDYSDVYVAAAQARNTCERITIERGDGCSLRFADASFDRALTLLVLQHVSDPGLAVRELRRVVRPGGVVAAAVWDTCGGMLAQRIVWENAAVFDPNAATRRAATMSRRAALPGGLASLFRDAGLAAVDEQELLIRQNYADFEDYWVPMASGEGSVGAYLSTLSADDLARLEALVRASYLSGAPDGPRSFTAVAFSVRGVVPG